ncbi:ABC transporter permease [Pedobacter hartonius]|uniref:Duplicated orphan permease n=1 Tax=Pedobacter hartonius TaxID=425514 RepID=A0A1H4BP86_9SPHI|nr:ABC transporter permease [Pedobacter hartonius]SEA49907.1 duplicated orphan permease [Pedobacter hartonius]
MFKLNLKIAWRNLWKNKGYTLINILGLSIGMASCILIFIFIRFQLSFDEGYQNGDRIYRFVTNWKYNSYTDYSQGVPIPLIAAARNEFAGFEKVAALLRRGRILHVKDDRGKVILKTEEGVFYAEPDLFEIISIPWLYGKPVQALAAPNTVALSESMALKFFGGTEKAVGRSILLSNQTNLKVTGVFKDMPENSSFPLKIVVSYQTFEQKNGSNWDAVASQTECYVLLKKGVHIADLQKPLAQFNKKYFEDKKIAGNQNNSFQSLSDIHFSERYGNFSDTSITMKEIYGLAVIGLFLMLTACINFINLATAQAINRSKEVGIRKVMGSKRQQLVIQFLTETFAIVLMSMLLACILSELAIPAMANLFSDNITFSLFSHPAIFIFIGILIIIVSFLAGFYPAMIMSGFSPALAIKNKLSVNSSGLNLRKVLVVVQFAVTIILIIGTLVIIRQMEYIRQKPLGFTTESIAMVNTPGDSLSRTRYRTFKEQVLRVPGVQMLSYCTIPPLSEDTWTTDFSYNGIKNKDFEVRISIADENYFKLFGLQLLAGKAFVKSDRARGCVVNQTFIRKLGITNPEDVIGKIIAASGNESLPVVGVVKDFNDRSLKESTSPLLIEPNPDEYYKAAIKIEGKQLMPAMRRVEALWNNAFPNYIYHAKFIGDEVNKYYESERVMGVLFKVFAGVIIFISFIGLFGLISFVVTQRNREVAIRKVLGASTMELVKMLNSSFLLMVFIANLVAWPLAYMFVSKWLSGFAYRIDLSIWPFAIAFSISMFITLITVSIRSYRVAAGNTIDALKYE